MLICDRDDRHERYASSEEHLIDVVIMGQLDGKGTTAGGGRSFGRGIISFWIENQWYIIGLISVIGVGLGYIGFMKYYGDDRSHLDYLYYTLQLFGLEFTPGDGSLPLELEIARFLLPILTIYTIARAMFSLFREQMRGLRIHMFYKDHVIICGLGEKGASLARDFREHGEKVVVIEIDKDNPDIRNAMDLGALVIIGDAANRKNLIRAGIERARTLIVTCDDDSTNIEVAIKANKIGHKTGLGTHVHLDNSKFTSLFERSRGHAGRIGRGRINFFNVFENGARQLLMEHPPDIYADRNSGGDVRMLVIGFGSLGESLILQAIKTGHFRSGCNMDITVMDEGVRRRGELFLNRYDKISNITDVKLSFKEIYMDGSGCFDTKLVYRNDLEPMYDILYMCLEDDTRGQTSALNINMKPRPKCVPIVVNIIQNLGFAAILQNRENRLLENRNIHFFTPIQNACRREIVVNERLDLLARTFHENYLSMRGSDRKRKRSDKDPSLRQWSDLPLELKDSNRQQADHMEVKLRTIGCELVPGGQGKGGKFSFKPEEVEMLARMEHHRWNADRFLDGWRYGKKKDTEKKVSPYLLNWEDPNLTEDIKDYDREFVRRVPRILRNAAPERFRIVREK